MANVIVDKNKIDLLANAISAKSGEPLTLTLDEMVEAVDSIESGITPTGTITITTNGITDVASYATADVQVPSPTLQTKSVTPTESAQTVTADVGYDGLDEVDVGAISSTYVGSGITRRSSSDLTASGATVSVPSGYYQNNASKAVATGTAGTPTATKVVDVSDTSALITPSVTNTTGYITGGTITGTPFYVTASELVAGNSMTADDAGSWDVANYETLVIPSGTEGTPTATKGTVTNHSVTVTPSVTNTAGYISGGTHNGTAVSVSASELVSGSQTVTENDTYDVTNLATLVVNVSGGSSTVAVGAKTATLSASASSIQFTGLSGNPTSFVVTSSADQSTGGTKVVAVAWDGTSFHGMDVTTQAEADTGFTKSYSSGTLTITATTASFQANAYKLVYTYGGSASDIETADVQVGSGATSITFSVNGRPAYWSCIFKSDFSTSSGYQRVIAVANDGSSTYGLAMDSSANVQTSWTASYSGGNFTINSQSTNNGGYFHQPGYYQLTYYVDPSAPSYQSKTVTPTTSQQIITADAGYDALSQVTVNAIPNTYVQPTSTVGATTYRPGTTAQTIASGTYHSAAATISAVTQTNLTAANIKSGTTITISNGQSNLWSVTGTYTGGGSGGSFSVATTTWTNSSNQTTSHEFTGLSGTPKFAVLRCTSQLTRSSSNTYYYIADIVWNGTAAYGNYHLRSNGSFNNVASNATTKFTVTTGTNSITFTSGGTRGGAPGSFYNGTYELTYVY